MATQTLEGTWEEIAARGEELAGKRVTVIVESIESAEGIAEESAGMNVVTDFSGIPRVGPPNEGMLAALREIRQRQTGRRQTDGDSVAIIRHGRTGPIYGREAVDD